MNVQLPSGMRLRKERKRKIKASWTMVETWQQEFQLNNNTI
jgi:hypothetical protein